MQFSDLKSREDLQRFLETNEGLDVGQLVPLPHPYEAWEDQPIGTLTDEQKQRYEVGPDGVSALRIPVPETEEERDRLVAKFLDGRFPKPKKSGIAWSPNSSTACVSC